MKNTMHPILNKNTYLVKEHLGLFKAANNYDIYDPDTGAIMMTCREERLGFITKLLRFTNFKKNTPFDIEIKSAEGVKLLRIKRGISFFISKVQILDEHDCVIGKLKQKLFSIGGAFSIFDAHDQPICELKGKWTGWEFKFWAGDQELAHITKKWAGIGKEMLTTADNYVLQISDRLGANDVRRQLILGTVFCIDMVLAEDRHR